MPAKPHPQSQHYGKLCGHKPYESGDVSSSNCHVTSCWLCDQRDHMTLRVGPSHVKWAPWLVWCPWVFCKWRYNVFNLLHDLTRPLHWGVLQIHGWELLVLHYYPDRYGDQRHCDCGDMFLICHVTSYDYMFNRLCEFMGGSISG